MTELAEAPTAGRDETITRIPHWIDGAQGQRDVGTDRPRLQPGGGRADRRGRPRLGRGGRRGGAERRERRSPGWRATSLAKRAELFFRIRELVHAHREDIAKILTAEHGKVLSDAMGEVARGLEVVEYACGIPTLLKGGLLGAGVDRRSTCTRSVSRSASSPGSPRSTSPPWFPCGCGRRRSPAGTLRAEAVGEGSRPRRSSRPSCSRRPGCPDGVFNVVHGDKVAVDAMLEHPRRSRPSRSSARHRSPATSTRPATGHGKRVQALGGAKNHMIVLPDADVDMAADAAVSAGYGSAGERCMAVSVVVAVGDVADPLSPRSRNACRRSRSATAWAPTSEMGPLVTREHRDKVASYIESGAGQGATVVATGARPHRPATASSSACRCSTT